MDADAYAKLIEALRFVRERQASGADDWEYSLLRTFTKYLQAIGVDRDLIAPVWTMYIAKIDEIEKARRRKEGKPGTPMPVGRENALAFASAAVTVLKKQGSGKIGDVLTSVARASKIERKAIKNFRDNINRGLLSPRASQYYKEYVRALKTLPPEVIMELLPIRPDLLAAPL